MKVRNSLPEIPFTYSISFSAPTQQIKDGETALRYFDPRASYIVIPGIEHSCVFNSEQIIIEIMPYTSNRLVDICLPYIQITKKKQVFSHMARYIICDRRLIGIKIKPSQKWPRSQLLQIQPSSALTNFYYNQGIVEYPEAIQVGQFFIQTQNFRIAPLFESEISSLSQNTIKSVLTEYYIFGCEIFSVMNDMTEDKKRNLKNAIQILKNHRRESTIVVYSGSNIACGMNEFYKTTAFAMQGNQYYKEIRIQNLDRIYKQSFVFDLNQLERRRKVTTLYDTPVGKIQLQKLNCQRYRIKRSYLNMRNNLFNSQQMDLQQEPVEIVTKQNLIQLYLWYLYQSVNHKNPFVLPWPMDNSEQLLMKEILKLSHYLKVPKSQLFSLMKIDQKTKIPKSFEAQGIKIISIDKVFKQQNNLYIYFPWKERLQHSVISKEKYFNGLILSIQKKIVNCIKCIGQDFLKLITETTNQSQQNLINGQVLDNQNQKFIQKFLKKKSNISLQLFYTEVAKYYPQAKLNEEFFKNLYLKMQQKIRIQYNGSPFQTYILENDFQQIKYVLRQSQNKYFTSNLKMEQEHNDHNDEQNQQNNFRKFLGNIRNHCNKQKRDYNVCHICKCLFHKQQKANFGRKCLGCSNFICYACFDQRTGENAQSQQMFHNCLICQKLCNCQDCLRKLNKNLNKIDSQVPSLPQGQIPFKIDPKRMQPIKQIKCQYQNQYPVQSIIPNLQQSVVQSHQNKPQPLKSCPICQLFNRNDRNIDFECSQCRNILCLSCQKSQNFNRKWNLRGSIICNNCYQSNMRELQKIRQFQKLNHKFIQLQHQYSQLKNKIGQKNLEKYNDNLEEATRMEIYQTEDHNLVESNIQRGNATPIFERNQRTATQVANSPYRSEPDKLNENDSVASFGNQKSHKKQLKRRNSSNSSNIESPPKNFQKKKEKNQTQLSNNNRNPQRNRESSPNSSRASSNKRSLKNDKNSVQSGQYQESSSQARQHRKNSYVKEWKNVHNNSFSNYNSENKNRKMTNYPPKEGSKRNTNYNRDKGQGNKGKHQYNYKNKDRNQGQRFQKGGNKGRGGHRGEYSNDRTNNQQYSERKRNQPERRNSSERQDNPTKNSEPSTGLLFGSSKPIQNDFEY